MFTKHKIEVKVNKVYSVMDGWNQFAWNTNRAKNRNLPRAS